jgi:hypothetical protein
MDTHGKRIAKGEPGAWVALPSEAALRPAMAGSPYALGFVPAMGRLLLGHPEIGQHFMRLYHEIMFAPERILSRREREMVAGVSAAAQDCFY